MKKPYGYVYMIRNLMNKKVYIGATSSPKKRWRWHKYVSLHPEVIAKHRRSSLHLDMRKFGISNFVFEILCKAYFSRTLTKSERKWIMYFNATNPAKGYNSNLSTSIPDKITRMIWSEKTSKRMLGVHHSKITKNRIGKGQRGKSKSEAHKKAISESIKKWHKRGVRKNAHNISISKINQMLGKLHIDID